MNFDKWLNENVKDLKGKTVGITGSTGGLGKEIVKILASLGANMIFIDRNLNRSKDLKKNILEQYPNIQIQIVIADQMDIESVKKASEEIEQIDYLILNAGAYNLNRDKSSLGYDNVFQINTVSPYYLVKCLLAKLQGGKVILVGSISYLLGKYNKKDLDYSNQSNKMKVYANSKRCIMFSLNEFLKYENVSLSIGHPGISPTNILSNYPKWLKKIIDKPMKWIFMSPKKASLSIIKALLDDTKQYTWYGPRIINVWGRPLLQEISYKPNESREYYLALEEIIEKIATTE